MLEQALGQKTTNNTKTFDLFAAGVYAGPTSRSSLQPCQCAYMPFPELLVDFQILLSTHEALPKPAEHCLQCAHNQLQSQCQPLEALAHPPGRDSSCDAV